MKYTKYSLETKVQIVIDFIKLTEKIPVAKFCKQYNISPNTFSHWLVKYDEQTLTVDLRIHQFVFAHAEVRMRKSGE